MKRHLIIMEFYVYEESNEGAIELAEAIAENQRTDRDNQCTVTAVYDAPFGEKPVLIKGTETETVK